MKKNITIYLSKELLQTIDELAVNYKNRSDFIETVLRKATTKKADAQKARAIQDAKDIELINKHADELNEEAMDVLTYACFSEPS